MFQSRNRDAFLFKAYQAIPDGRVNRSFNLVIEMLFFSSLTTRICGVMCVGVSFNLVIEMLFFSSCHFGNTSSAASPDSKSFQSRNRDAFLFKFGHQNFRNEIVWSFNLVIEMLFFSSPSVSKMKSQSFKFQSRNRDAFLFKPKFQGVSCSLDPGSFNLVIEMLFFSSKYLCYLLKSHFFTVSIS